MNTNVRMTLLNGCVAQSQNAHGTTCLRGMTKALLQIQTDGGDGADVGQNRYVFVQRAVAPQVSLFFIAPTVVLGR